MTTFIYRLTNTINGKVYVGKTTDVARRWFQHQWFARRGSQLPIHRAIRKYGSGVFLVEVLSRHSTGLEANLHEKRLISDTPFEFRYNVAPGGEGGHTMSQAQLDSQYSIKPDRYEEFRQLFHGRTRVRDIATHLGVSINAVLRCAKRLGLVFRKGPKKKDTPKKRRAYVSEARLTPDQRHRLRSDVAARTNKIRGIPEDLKVQVRDLYFTQHLTAQEVANVLGITKGSVRATVNAAYLSMSPEEHLRHKRLHGSAVRKGCRNSNYKGRNPCL